MNRNGWIIVVVVLALAGGVGWMTHAHKDAPKFRTAAVERGDITATVSATGNVQPVLQVQVGSQVSGTVSKLYVDYNSQVKAGQVLAQLETSAFRARLAQAEAAVARAQAALHNGQLSLQRATELQKGNFLAQSDVDAAQATVDGQKADLKQAQAALESAQVDLNHATITSPIDGVVISRSIDVGQTVAASLQAPQLFIIGNDLRQMQVQTNIDEADIGRIRPGLQAKFTVDAYPDANFTGTVVQVRLVPQVTSNVVTYQTLISARNDQLRLRPGMTANVTIEIETHKDVLKVANGALRFKPPGWQGGKRGADGSAGAGGSGGGMGAGGTKRGFAALMEHIVPTAFAQEAPGASPTPAGKGAKRGGASIFGGRESGTFQNLRGVGGDATSGYKPGGVFLLKDARPFRVRVLTGLTDGMFTEVKSDSLKAGDNVITALETPQAGANNLTPPPGMGGPSFRGPGGGGRGR